MVKRIGLFGSKDIEAHALQRLRDLEPPDGYYFADSGGKDSCVCRHLLQKSGVKFDSHYHWTTVDPPELLYFIREYHPDTVIEQPQKTMWQLIVEKRMPPTRIVRYCCAELKERGGSDRTVITGIRWAESVRRSKRKGLEVCHRQGKMLIHPIIEWSDAEVWMYIRAEKIPYCKLYDEGKKRIGCIGCPMAGKRGMMADFERYPKHRAAYVRAFQRMIETRIADGFDTQWTTGEEVMDWWIHGSRKDSDDGMATLFDY